jgi:hypothetical protein
MAALNSAHERNHLLDLRLGVFSISRVRIAAVAWVDDLDAD